MRSKKDFFLEQLRLPVEMRKSMHQKTRSGKNYRFFGAEDLVLKFGREFKGVARLKHEFEYDVPQHCYQNAYKAAIRRGSPWIYTEGFGYHERLGLAVAHAWLTRADTPGVAYDPTWSNPWIALHSGRYFGVQFSREFVSMMHKRSNRKYYGLFDLPEQDWPLITGEVPIELGLYVPSTIKP